MEIFTAESPIYLLVILASLLGLLLGVIAIANLLLLKKSFELKKENNRLTAELQGKINAHIETIGNQLLDLLSTSAKRSEEIIEKTRFFSAETKTQFLSDLSIVREDEKKAYMQSLEQARDDMVKSFKNMSNDIEKDLKEQVNTFKMGLVTQLQDVRRDAQQKAQVYEDLLLQKTEDSVYELLADLSLQLLHRSLTPADHEELIANAIKEAKSRYVI